jgi:hypothetical protein
MNNEFWINRWIGMGLCRLEDNDSYFVCDTLEMNVAWNGRLMLQPHKEMNHAGGRFSVHSARAGLPVNEIMNIGI